MCLGQPKTPTIYRRRGGGCAPSRVPTPRRGGSPRLDGGGGQEGERGGAHPRWALGPSAPRVFPLPLFHAPWASCGWRTSPPRGWYLPTLGPRRPPGLVAPPGGPPEPSGGPGTLPVTPETLPVAKTGLPIYKSLPPDHSGTPHDVRGLIRDSEQHSVTTYIYSL